MLTVPISRRVRRLALRPGRLGGRWRWSRRCPGSAWSRHDRSLETVAAAPSGSRDVARTRLGWVMALFFGLQSLQAYSIFGWFAELYRDAGFSAHTAGLLLGRDHRRSASRCRSWLPAAAARSDDQRG